MDIPSTHQGVMPYLILKDAKRFIDFATLVFGANVTHYSERDADTLGHCELQIHGNTIMFSDTTDVFPAQNANLFIYVPNADMAFNKAIENGAIVIQDLSDQPYGRTCGVKDPFGNVWWITSL